MPTEHGGPAPPVAYTRHEDAAKVFGVFTGGQLGDAVRCAWHGAVGKPVFGPDSGERAAAMRDAHLADPAYVAQP